MKLTEYGTASPTIGLSKEDERGTSLAMRAQNGDYDEGEHILAGSTASLIYLFLIQTLLSNS